MTEHLNSYIREQSNILGLDTALGEIAACIIKCGQVYVSPPDAHSAGKTRSTSIIPMIHQLLRQAGLDWKQLDLLAFGSGPGSFTGLRIGAATLAGINAGLRIPVVHLSSLAITARQVVTEQTVTAQIATEKTATEKAVQVLEDARAGEVFVGHYQNGRALQVDACLSWQDIEAREPGLFCCNSEPPVRLNYWKRLPLTLPRSQALAIEVAAACSRGIDLSSLPIYPSPRYLQLSQAERQVHG
ncbi:MAG: tRNA (adenosine(37)-N6)-threonylcarbamoyltransferase complex dimerization subunit type 1 TsaB [Mariprofundus sp.]|nr:tRNA (adenosine(37)-N6)-threonylcarbamoyltransferase complex dimerization subunit type 1 TsaB [Mariprofundus sp.]